MGYVRDNDQTHILMKKKRSQSSKWFSDVQLNWDAVNSFISDVEVKDNIPAIKAAAEVARKTKSVIRNKDENTKSSNTPNSEPVEPIRKKTKESLLDIVEDLDSCAKARIGMGIAPIARVHCLYDEEAETFWFTNRAYSPRELSGLSAFGRFVPKYSDVAIKMQKNEVGTSFDYISRDYIKRLKTHVVRLENQSNLQNQTISLAGDSLKYQFRNIQEFLKALRQYKEDIRDIDSKIFELEEKKKEKLSPKERAQITNSIKKFREEYRILTQQQEDLKNITIYIIDNTRCSVVWIWS